jgi:LysM repeat protein
MNRTDNSGTGIAGLGRGEDSMLAHVAPGEMVVPPVISPQTQKIIEQEMMSAGLDPSEYTVGQGMSINPITGMAEFGFLKKLGKSLKKVVKKVAPIAGALLIPGVGGALGGALSSAGAALGIPSGIGSSLLGGKGILDTAAAVRGGIAGLTGLGGGEQPVEQTIEQGDTLTSIAAANNVSVEELMAANPTIKDANAIVAGNTIAIPGVNSPNIFRQVLGSTPGQSGIGVIEDLIKGRESDFTKERGEGGGLLSSMTGSTSGGGLNPAMLAMAALYGKAVKEDYKRKEGGLKDIRQSVRPDLMPAPTFQGFDLGIRPGMKYGGSMDEEELDMRMGGPSIGPGTGTSDDIPAMLSDGEFVMTSAANNGLGGFKVTKTETGIELIPSGKPNRQKGAKNMDKLMKTFEQFNKVGQA